MKRQMITSTILLLLINVAAVKEAKVLILGAGAAGLTAAKTLHEHGEDDFIIIEAENRIGGRMKTTNFGGKVIELGANWVQGTEGNILWEMAKKAKLAGKVSNYRNLVTRNHKGRDVTDEYDAARELYERAEKIAESKRKHLKKLNIDITRRAALNAGGWPWRRTPVQDSFEYFDIDYEYAAYAEGTSFMNKPYAQDTFKHEDYFVTDQRGFSTTLKQMVVDFLGKNDTRLHFGEQVSAIDYRNNGVWVNTKSGKWYRGDYAICTFSIGVMQNDEIKFEPPIPEMKKIAYDSFTMATFTKTFMRFAKSVKRFWDDVGFIIYADLRRGYYPVWQNLEAKGLFPEGTNMLVVAGYEAARITRMLNKEVKKEVTEVLRTMYGKNVPVPEEILVPDWHINPLYYGSYSNWPASMTVKQHNVMRANLGPLYFAGEGYSPAALGYVFSGEEVANDVFGKINPLPFSSMINILRKRQ